MQLIYTDYIRGHPSNPFNLWSILNEHLGKINGCRLLEGFSF